MTFAASISLPRQTCDLLKIVAALLVITAHMASTALGAKYGSDHVAFYAIASQNGYIGVAVFFFLSGFGLMESEQKAHLDLKSFVRRRLMKIYLPVVLVSCLWLSLLYALPSVAEHQKWGGYSTGVQHYMKYCGISLIL
ncbi:acyltransferase family protein [uncultured Duncaniella sp.]|uniref:acyltransferase family protein n=1 Tax=uncultured Duncaniella sp. TaxID=2768039 RepID=UPI0034A2CC03